MTTKNIKKTMVWVTSITGLLSAILLIHIIMVYKPQKIDNATIQLAKINVDTNSDKSEISAIISNLRNIEGVKIVNYFGDQSAIVTAFDNRATDNKTLLECVQSLTASRVAMDLPDASTLAKGCPFGVGDSFSGRISMVVKKLFY